jgi:hypothetical protein
MIKNNSDIKIIVKRKQRWYKSNDDIKTIVMQEQWRCESNNITRMAAIQKIIGLRK